MQIKLDFLLHCQIAPSFHALKDRANEESDSHYIYLNEAQRTGCISGQAKRANARSTDRRASPTLSPLPPLQCLNYTFLARERLARQWPPRLVERVFLPHYP